MEERLVRPREAAKMLGISKTSLWHYASRGIIPSPIKLGPRTTAWRYSELLRVIEERSGKEAR